MFQECPRRTHRRVLVSLCLAAGLSACGGGGGGSSKPSNTITASACKGQPLVGTRMSCPPSASASSSF